MEFVAPRVTHERAFVISLSTRVSWVESTTLVGAPDNACSVCRLKLSLRRLIFLYCRCRP